MLVDDVTASLRTRVIVFAVADAPTIYFEPLDDITLSAITGQPDVTPDIVTEAVFAPVSNVTVAVVACHFLALSIPRAYQLPHVEVVPL